ncbi:MAG: (2Fe-2S) ferredoxin domain-containing protein [Chlorobi bacterium]|nr:(2Fe-2S) ferredoxin domain-containing protein [Chlorobiota bacterium]
MAKVKSLDDLKKIKEEFLSKEELQKNGDKSLGIVQIKVAMATCGIASGAKKTMDYLINELDNRAIDAVVTQTGCMGYCYAEPTIEVTLPGKEPVVFGYVDEKRAGDIIEKYIQGGELVGDVIPVNYETIEEHNIE